MKIPPLYFKEFKTKTYEELYSFTERYIGYDLLIFIRTKYNEDEEWSYSYELLTWDDFCFEWKNGWNEGQEFIEYLGGAVIDYCTNLEGI